MRWPQKARKVTIAPELFEQLFQEGLHLNHTVAKGVPAGAKVIGVTFDFLTRMTTILFSYEDWEPVYSAIEAPSIVVEWSRGNEKAT